MNFFQVKYNRICFSRWCRKGYAVFAAIGRQVRICALSIGICMRALDKSGRKGVIVTTAGCVESADVLPDPEMLFSRHPEIHIARGYLCPDTWVLKKVKSEEKDMSFCGLMYPFFNVYMKLTWLKN